MFNRKEWMKIWKTKNAEKLKAQGRALYWKKRDLMRKQCRNYYLKTYDSLKQKAKSLRLRWGLTLEQLNHYTILRQSQCDICRIKTALVIDHDHSTGEIRGFLCTKCNKALGLFQDNLTNITIAKLYLQRRLKCQTVPEFLPLTVKKQIGS